MNKSIRKEILRALGQNAPTDIGQDLLIQSAEQCAILASQAYQRVVNSEAPDSPITQGHMNRHIRYTVELARTLKVLGLVRPAVKRQSHIKAFFRKAKEQE